MDIDDDWWRRGKSPHDDESWEDNNDNIDEMLPRCRVCGADLFDDETVRCPSCGGFQSEESAPVARHPGWIIVTAFVLVLMTLYWIVKH